MARHQKKHESMMYHYEQGLSDHAIANKVGCSRSSVSYWRKKNKLPANNACANPPERQRAGSQDFWLSEILREGLSIMERPVVVAEIMSVLYGKIVCRQSIEELCDEHRREPSQVTDTLHRGLQEMPALVKRYERMREGMDLRAATEEKKKKKGAELHGAKQKTLLRV